MAFLLDSLKEKFSDSGDSGSEGFPDMNYMIGNSSAMDVGEVPTPLDQRIGYAAQVGGSVMELQITNPSTFTLERDKMISTIDQLGIDVALHSDMNAGYASAQKSGQGESYGYETVEDYFTEYIQELAAFKKEVERRGGQNGPLFNIGRINPHIATTPLPPLDERMETDVGVDPFGFTINEYDENARKQRNHRKQNIYKNPDFLKNLYYTLVLEMSNYPFQNYQTFGSYSEKFDEAWREAQHESAERIFETEASDLEDKLGAVLVARNNDQGIGTNWREFLADWGDIDVHIYTPNLDTNGEYKGPQKEEQLSLNQVLEMSGERGPRLRTLDDLVFDIKRGNIDYENFFQIPRSVGDRLNDNEVQQFVQDVQDEINISETVVSQLDEALLEFWKARDDEEERYMTQEAKWAGLQSHLEVQQIRLLEKAYDIGREDDIEEMAATIFSGEDLSLFDGEDVDEREAMHEDLLERLLQGQQFQREMWKESTIFYQVIPAWMAASSNDDHEFHKGWEAPEFIWEALVKRWEDRDDLDINVEIDLTSPRNGVYDKDGDDTYHFFDLLENYQDFQYDVAAAVGACYAWAHFTQRKSQFDLKGRDFGLDSDEAGEVRNKGWTWVEWMNRFGIGVNLETMAGSPQQKFKVWRPKDISVAAHAINMTARNQLEKKGDLGGLSEIHPELDGCPAKFTIDMEHVASLGATPWNEMELFIEQEKELAGDWPELEIDLDKPIAKILRQYHLMDPGVEGQRGTHHGAFKRGNTLIYEWLYNLAKEGFARNENEPATILFELAEHKGESSYMMRLSMDLIELGVTPEELDPGNVSPGDEPESREEALIARFFGIDRSSYDREWAKIEEHAFDPLEGLLQTEEFDNTSTGSGAIDQAGNRPMEWKSEEYK